jgi:putative transposase
MTSAGREGLVGKKVVTPEQRRTAVTSAMDSAGISERQACRFTGFARSSQRYTTRRPSDTALRERLHTLAILRPRWGYRRLYRLLRREGLTVNRTRVQRGYRDAGSCVTTDRNFAAKTSINGRTDTA